MLDGVRQKIARLQNLWRQQPRLRLGSWLLAGLLVLNLLWSVGDARRQLEPELRQLVAQQSRVNAILAEEDWELQAGRLEALRREVEQRLWQADSRGLALATFEGYLEAEASRTNLNRWRIEMQTPLEVDDIDGLLILRARLEADHDPAALIDFLEALATAATPVSVHALSTRSLRPPRSRIELRAVFRVQTAESSF